MFPAGEFNDTNFYSVSYAVIYGAWYLNFNFIIEYIYLISIIPVPEKNEFFVVFFRLLSLN